MRAILDNKLGPLAVLGLFTVGCFQFESTIISPDDYDRSCTSNEDCVLAIDWDACDGCPPCAPGAISVVENARYTSELRRAESMCRSNARCLKGCDISIAVCLSGQCEARPEGFVEPPPEDMERVCQQDSDCVAYRGSDPCNTCSCTDLDPINIQSIPAGEDPRQCSPAPASCVASCSTKDEAVCQNNQCILEMAPPN